jgi:uncharacterized protein YunC (DUF1805 family)
MTKACLAALAQFARAAALFCKHNHGFFACGYLNVNRQAN